MHGSKFYMKQIVFQCLTFWFGNYIFITDYYPIQISSFLKVEITKNIIIASNCLFYWKLIQICNLPRCIHLSVKCCSAYEYQNTKTSIVACGPFDMSWFITCFNSMMDVQNGWIFAGSVFILELSKPVTTYDFENDIISYC